MDQVIDNLFANKNKCGKETALQENYDVVFAINYRGYMYLMIKSLLSATSKGSDSGLVVGIAALLVNIGSKYVDLRLTKGQEELLKGAFLRELLIFAIVWLKTRNVLLSVLVTAAFMILAEYLFNEHSSACILPEQYKKLARVIDADDDGALSDREIERAYNVLRRARDQKRYH